MSIASRCLNSVSLCQATPAWYPVLKRYHRKRQEDDNNVVVERPVLWKKLDEKARLKQFQHLDSPKEKSVDFQSKLKQYVDEIKLNSLVTKPLLKTISPSTLKHPFSKLLAGELEKDEDRIQIDDSTLRELARLHAYFIEMPGRLKIPKCNFDSFSYTELKVLLQECLSRSSGFNFLMHKSAMRSNGKRQKAKNTVVEENYGSVLFRRNMVPYHHVEKESRVFCNWHLLSGAPLDNPIIFDMGFEDLMKRKSLVDLCAQLTATLNYNTTVHYPVPLLFANLDQDSFFYKRMKQFNVHSFPDGCMSVTEKGLTDLDNIPIESLIYLSPDATETINEYQEDKVYVIGGLVDLGAVQAQKSTLTIANELGIKRQKLPLSKYLLWGNRSGRRALSLDIIFKVLLELRSTGNWAKAFQHIPVRCHRGLTECGIEEAEKTKDINLMRHYADIFQHKERVSKPRNNKDSYQFLAWDSKA